jgi:ADP-ribosylglycohydrolase
MESEVKRTAHNERKNPMEKRHEKRSKVMTIANSLVKDGVGRSAAMLKAWALIKLAAVDTRAAGVTHGKRQRALEHLERYPAGMVSVSLVRERENAFDKNAVAVVASVAGKGSYVVGYVPRMLAAFLAPLMDAGKGVQASYRAVTGGFDRWPSGALQSA